MLQALSETIKDVAIDGDKVIFTTTQNNTFELVGKRLHHVFNENWIVGQQIVSIDNGTDNKGRQYVVLNAANGWACFGWEKFQGIR